MPELLVEVGCEELPSSACHEIIAQAPELFAAALAGAGFETGWTLEVSVAPRRFAISSGSLPARLPDRVQEVRGPAAEAAFDADGAPTKAAQGFARGQRVAVEDLVVREVEGGRRFVFAERREEGRDLAEAVPDLVAHLVDGLRFGKTMRWGDGGPPRFSRPIRWIVAKVDEQTIPFELHGLTAGEVSQGHRFLGGPVTIGAASAYHAALESVGVLASHEARRARIVAGLDAAAEAAGGSWRDPGRKLEEVLFLVEHPSVITGRFDPAHLELPSRVLITAMQSHQRYFPLLDADGNLLPLFLSVSNGDPAHAEVIGRGNEDVLDARLQDAAFSFQRDREAGLEQLDARLSSIVFHARLGTMAAKRDRLIAGVADIADAIGADLETAAAAGEAARLAKVDQGAVLVAEFSELEGYVAAEYARRAGRPAAVAQAVAEQYLPEGPDSPLPATEAGAILAAAEKLDNLVGAFAVDEAPTGSKDPYGLRRAAMGLVRIALDRGWDIDHCPPAAAAHARLAAQGADLKLGVDETVLAVSSFLADRLTYVLTGEGLNPESVGAAIGARLGSGVAVAAWARALDRARGSAALAAVWTAQTRLARLAARGPDEERAFTSAGDPGEDALAEAVAAARPGIDAARAARDFDAALAAAEPVAPAVDRFFDDVLVNTDDTEARSRRYALVREAAAALGGVADFPRITDPGGSR
ncbi:MAG: glycyl-tRNA synthetase beta chain [Miltoncostaeaceae bacterium]|nr:glycyl-tRNA synthetase beta chain [Miltoncostaeaceae bacterium]